MRLQRSWSIILIALLLLQISLAQNATESAQTSEEPTEQKLFVGSVVYGTIDPYLNKKGIVNGFTESGAVVVRFEGSAREVMVDPAGLTTLIKSTPTSLDTPKRGETVVLEMHQVRELYNDVKAFYEDGSCTDGSKNQGETGIDCGGPCPLCDITPSEEIQNLKPFRASRSEISVMDPAKAIFGVDRAEAIPAPQLDQSDISRIAQAIKESAWGSKVKEDIEAVRTSVESVQATQEEVKTTADNIKVRVDTVNTNVNSVGEKVANIEQPIPELRSQVSRLSDQSETGSYLSIAAIVVMILSISLIGYLTYMVVALKHELHVATQTTPEDIQRIVDYFDRMIVKGYDPAVIKRELVKEGFSRASVDIAAKRVAK